MSMNIHGAITILAILNILDAVNNPDIGSFMVLLYDEYWFHLNISF
jgi:hypothetical protein